MDLETYLARCERNYSCEHKMLGQKWRSPGYHSQFPDGQWSHPTWESLDYVLALIRSGQTKHVKRAIGIVEKVLSLQHVDPTCRTYGIWPYLLEEPLEAMDPPDWNWADFCGIRLAQVLAKHIACLPCDLVRKIQTALGHAAWSIFRRNIPASYTNIAVMGAGVALAAGELLDEPRLLNYGCRRLARIVEHSEYHGGFNEYNSPVYNVLSLHECERILDLVKHAQAREDAEKLRLKFWECIADHFHPGTQQWAGPHARNCQDRLQINCADWLSEQTGAAIVPHPSVSDPEELLFDSVRHLPCPEERAARFTALPCDDFEIRSRFIRRDNEKDSRWGTTWLASAICLGTTNHESLWEQRRPLIGYWRTSDDPAVVVRLRFLHDGRDFASAYVYNAQRNNCVLSAVTLVTNKGDWHDHVDSPADGIFTARDFRLRYELSGRGVAGRELGNGIYELAAGNYRAVIHTAPGRFGPHTLGWQINTYPDKVCLDAICYCGPRRDFELARLGDIVIIAGLELLGIDQSPTEAGVTIGTIDDNRLNAVWPVERDRQLALTLPIRAEATDDHISGPW